jgi:hypothetical protein
MWLTSCQQIPRHPVICAYTVQILDCYVLFTSCTTLGLHGALMFRVGVAALCGDHRDWPIATGGVEMESTTTHTIGVARVEFTS